MSSGFGNIDFTDYWQLLRSIASCAHDLIAVGMDGTSVYVSPGVEPTAADTLASQVVNTARQKLRQGKILTTATRSSDIAIAGITDGNAELLGFVLALTERDSAAGISDVKPLARALAMVAKLLSREVQLLHDLDTVSDELGTRYEELNLLYSTEKDLQYFDDPPVAIAQLVEKTTVHLNVDAVALCIPERDITITRIEPGVDMTAADVKQATESILTIAIETGISVSANDTRDSDGGALFQRLGCKCQAIPLFDNRGVVEGVLVALNGPQSSGFSSSDRNILEVMARRVRWVLESASDALTGLLARHAFEQRLKAATVMSRTTGSTCAVLYANIDRLHVINDICGPHAGDAAICAVATVLEDMLAGDNVAARLGGDEFGVLVNNCNVQDAMGLANSICEKVAAIDFKWDEVTYDLSISVGIGPITRDTKNSDEILSAAEIACAEAKASGGGRPRVLQQNDTVLVMRQTQMKWIGRLQSALRESRFLLYAQAIQPLQIDDGTMHHEVLIRLRGENGEIVSPDEFLPSAERYNLMPDLDRWVVENTFEQLSGHWAQMDARAQAHEKRHCSWAINLSGQSMSDARMLKYILKRIEHYKLPHELICFEVTESAAVRNIGDARRLIAALRAYGCKFSLDDFGTGVSSFAYLKNLPVDYLKIDGSFVRPMLEDVASSAVVAAINQVAKAMGLQTIAEFVETKEIADKLTELGIDFAQGYAFARPIPLHEVLESRSSQLERISA